MLLVLPLGFSASGQLLPAFNVGSSLDSFLFGAHLLRPQQDPEGVLGTLSSIATALAGVAIGQLLRGTNRAREQQSGERHDLGTRDPQTARLKVRRLVAAGLATAALGALWATALPLNKALWTGSYALVTSGVTMVVLAAFAALDRASTRGLFAPLAWLGINPLAIYFLAELCSIVLQQPLLPIRGAATAPKDLVFWSVVAPLVRDDGGPLSSLLYALAYTAVWVGLAGVLRWRGIRLRL
jgi:predicted acyltransferase